MMVQWYFLDTFGIMKCEVFSFLRIGITVGFEEETYSAGESDGVAFVVAVVQSGELATSVVIDFTTAPQTAMGKLDIHIKSERQL